MSGFHPSRTYQSRQPTTQGAASGIQFFIAGFRRRLNDHATLEIEIIDPLDTLRTREFERAPGMSLDIESGSSFHAVSIGLLRTFGGG